MKIRRFDVQWAAGRGSALTSAEINSDLTIFTGRNGSGKTTVLKLLWYVISGNVEHAVREVPFTALSLETDLYKIQLRMRTGAIDELTFEKEGETTVYSPFDDDGDYVDLESVANELVKDEGASVFFPTFRRIEGGFSLSSMKQRSPFPSAGLFGASAPRPQLRGQGALEDAMIELSRRLTVSNHTFVSAISTVDIVSLLMRQYTDMSDLSNNLQHQVSQRVISTIKNHRAEDRDEQAESANRVLEQIMLMIEELDTKRDQILSPLNAVRSLVEKLFQHKGITLNTRLSFGDAANAVSSDALSAGEKQMLSFICYNAFYKNSVIFIDEPELSLHVDWQRQLFPILEGQGTSNQFIIATHSPFIYSKYSDKEVSISPDRGDSEEVITFHPEK